MCACVLPGVEGPMLPRDGDDAIEDTEVDGDGGLVLPFGSKLVRTLEGLLILREILRLR